LLIFVHLKLTALKNFTCRNLPAFIAAVLITLNGFSQHSSGKDKPDLRCGTVYAMEQLFKQNPDAKKAYENASLSLAKAYENKLKSQNTGIGSTQRLPGTLVIPVVFHIVLPNPGALPDSYIIGQLDSLNIDYAGLNADSIIIPDPALPNNFKSRFAKGNIQFCLAKRDPNGEPTTGIVRVTSVVSSISNLNDPIKYSSRGGSDAWDPDKYLNIWVGVVGGGILGYASLANQKDANGNLIWPKLEQGVVVLFSSLPGGTAAPYNKGRTLTHEVGHYFWLRHIWGDDDGSCSGTDNPETPAFDDTPNQQDATGGCPSGIKIDACAAFPFGYMYQNYMDYTDDACMVMFTNGQVERMNLAITNFRPTLLTSDGCVAPAVFNRNIWMKQILFPTNQICANSFQPVIRIRNAGNDTLRSAVFNASVDGGSPVVTNWTGKLNPYTDAVISLTSMTTSNGTHSLKVVSSLPNGLADQVPANDTATVNGFSLDGIINTTISEGFEKPVFPPPGWVIDNPDGGLTWRRTSSVGSASTSCMLVQNYIYSNIAQNDRISTPVFDIKGADSTIVSFDVANATYNYPGMFGNGYDTLEILVTKDCGVTFSSVYKKWGQELTTVDVNFGMADQFIPQSRFDWRKEKIDLTPFVKGGDNIRVVFRNFNAFENNTFVDNVNLYNVKLSPLLKEKGLFISPNPFKDRFSVQHYPNSNTLRQIDIYNSMGQFMEKRTFAAGIGANLVWFNLGNQQAGIYYVKLIYSDRTITQKIVKTN
jgi:Pregnancy-associated plasma protein-A/Secretion system C-terminal sorting domain